MSIHYTDAEKIRRLTAWHESEKAEITQLRDTITTLTAHNESMQADAVNNTATIKMLMAQLAEVNEENRGMRKLLRWEPK